MMRRTSRITSRAMRAAVAASSLVAAGACAASDGRADSAAVAAYDSVRSARPTGSLPPAVVVPAGATPATPATTDTARRGPRPPMRPPGGYIYIDTAATRESLRVARPATRPPR